MKNDKSRNEYKRTGITYQTATILAESKGYDVPKYESETVLANSEASPIEVLNLIGHFPKKNELIVLNGTHVVLNHAGKTVKISEVN